MKANPTNTTRASRAAPLMGQPAAPAAKDVATAMSDLECDLGDVATMASIASRLMEHAFKGTPKERADLTGRPDFYFFTNETIEQLLFAVFHTQRMCEQFQASFYKALGEEVSPS